MMLFQLAPVWCCLDAGYERLEMLKALNFLVILCKRRDKNKQWRLQTNCAHLWHGQVWHSIFKVIYLPDFHSPVFFSFLTLDWDLGNCLKNECYRKQLRMPQPMRSWIDLRATYKVTVCLSFHCAILSFFLTALKSITFIWAWWGLWNHIVSIVDTVSLIVMERSQWLSTHPVCLS